MIASADLRRRQPDALSALLCGAVLAAIVPAWPLGGSWLGAALPLLDLAPWWLPI